MGVRGVKVADAHGGHPQRVEARELENPCRGDVRAVRAVRGVRVLSVRQPRELEVLGGDIGCRLAGEAVDGALRRESSAADAELLERVGVRCCGGRRRQTHNEQHPPLSPCVMLSQ